VVDIRRIKTVFKSKPTTEGAGVQVNRVFGHSETDILDPFLLLDHFGSDNPDEYIAGFPWHPHRGIETITYMLNGRVEHGDSPSHQKMMHPRYQDIKKDTIPEVTLDSGAKVKIICGEMNGIRGPVQDIVTEPQYYDIELPPGTDFKHSVKEGHNVFAYVFEGKGLFGEAKEEVGTETLALFDEGEYVVISSQKEKLRLLLISGKPIGEPVAWYGPIVMNTNEELDIAFREYKNGTFIKHD